ncbi:MAG: immunoglobulin domain-containing protein, partial [Eubacterium sp.]
NTEIKGEAYQEDYFYAVAALVCNSNPFNPNMTFKNNLEVFNGSEINAKAGFYSDMDQVPNDEKNNDGFVKGIWSFGGILANNSSILAEANLNAQKKMEIPVMIDGIRSVRIDEDSATGHIKAEESSIQGKAVSNLPKLQDNQNMGGIWADQFIELNDSDMAGTGSNWGIASKENLIVNGLRNDQSVMGKAYQDGVGIVSVTGDIDLTKNHITLPATGVIGKTDNVRFSDANAVLEVKGSQKAAAEAIIQSGIPVKILENPSDITLKPKGKATFSVKTEGTSPITYKWEVSADGGKNWTMIDGATGESYAIEAVTAEMNGYQYRCTVSNSWGSTTSEAALLTVIAPPLPTPSNEGETNIKTGLTDKQSSAAYAIVLLSIAGLAAIGFRRKFTK